MIKYTGTCLSYILLVILYSYVDLYGYRQEYQLAEVILYAWILILVIDEFREVKHRPYDNFNNRMTLLKRLMNIANDQLLRLI